MCVFLHSIFRHEWFCLVLNKLRHSCNGSRWWKDCLSLQQIPFFTTHINRQTTRLAIGNRQMDNINWRLDIIKSIRCYDIVMEVTAWHHAILSARNGQMHFFIDCRIWWTHFFFLVQHFPTSSYLNLFWFISNEALVLAHARAAVPRDKKDYINLLFFS